MVIGVSMALDPSGSGPNGPVRTCIGCRKRTGATQLFRVVVATDSADGASPDALRVVPDLRHRLPGRGAWLHRDPRCVELAQRRKAFARALRAAGPVDPGAVVEYVSKTHDQQFHMQDMTSGIPQEMTSYGHSMKRQQ